jgi:hypothetical protein
MMGTWPGATASHFPISSGMSISKRRSMLCALAVLLALCAMAVPSEAYEKRFNCGGPAYTDSLGHQFVIDPVYTVQNGAGRVDAGPPFHAGFYTDPSWQPTGGTDGLVTSGGVSADTTLFRVSTYLWSQYKFDVPNGSYLVRLRFADLFGHGPGQRVQDIKLENTTVLDDLDIYAVAGDHYAISYTFPVQVSDGQLNIFGTFSRVLTQINAIEVWDAPPNATPPATPTGFSISPSFGQMQLDWKDNAEADLNGYYLERATSPSGPWQRLTAKPIPRSRFTDLTTQQAIPYYYRVLAVDAFGNESNPTSPGGSTILPDTATQMPIYRITIDPAEWAILNDDPESDTYVHGSFSYNGQTWNNVGIRYRGRTSRAVSKKNWKVKFDKFVNGQEFVNGWKELNLNSQYGENTMIRNSLAWELTGRVGVENAESGHIMLKVNNEYFGVYDSIEPIDQRWLANHGYPPGGSLYRAEFLAPLAVEPDTATYMLHYSKITNESTGFGDLIQFIELVNATPTSQVWNVLKSKFDIESFINYLAAMTALCNDSYFDHNYYLYHDLSADKWYWIPWDLDSTFGHEGIFKRPLVTNSSIFIGQQNVLINKLTNIDHFKRRFIERTLEILAEDLTPGAFNATIDSAASYIHDEALLDWRKWGWERPAWIDSAGIENRSFIPLRQNYVNAVGPGFLPLQEVFINEFMADNDGVIQDEAGDFDDWVEIVNLGIHPAILDGYYLTDNITLPTRWALPDTTIPPGAHIIFWCDQEPTEGPTHTNFELEKNGEWIGLYGPTPGAPPVDSKGFGNQIKDVSFGRFPDGNWNWTFMGTPTPEAPNLGQGNLPPTITQVDHNPVSPGLNVAVQVTARIVDDGTVSTAKVFYKTGSNPLFQQEPMRDDGNGGDQSAGDNIWTALLPGQPAPTVVNYYIFATDNQGRTATDPVDAPLDLHAYTVGFTPPDLVINEFVAQNTNGLQDEFGEFADWVEIWNAGQNSVSMLGLRLSDNLLNPNKYVFPDTTLAPGGFILVYCDNDPEQGVLHADFALAASGEQVGLFASNVAGFAVIDTLTFGPQQANISFGRYPDGGSIWRFYTTPTPRSPNATQTGIGDQPPGAVPLRLVLGPCRPNPTRSTAVIPFGLPTRGHTRLVIYDAAGRAVAELLDQVLEPGYHAADWNGAARGSGPGGAPAGVYFYRLDFHGETRTGKLTLLR